MGPQSFNRRKFMVGQVFVVHSENSRNLGTGPSTRTRRTFVTNIRRCLLCRVHRGGGPTDQSNSKNSDRSQNKRGHSPIHAPARWVSPCARTPPLSSLTPTLLFSPSVHLQKKVSARNFGAAANTNRQATKRARPSAPKQTSDMSFFTSGFSGLLNSRRKKKGTVGPGSRLTFGYGFERRKPCTALAAVCTYLRRGACTSCTALSRVLAFIAGRIAAEEFCNLVLGSSSSCRSERKSCIAC